MIMRFRTPTWYRMLLFAGWIFLFLVVENLFFTPLKPVLKAALVLLTILFGVWIIVVHKKEIVVDTEKKEVFFNKRSIRIDDIKDVKFGLFSVTFFTDEGIYKFPHPLSDKEVLKRILFGGIVPAESRNNSDDRY